MEDRSPPAPANIGEIIIVTAARPGALGSGSGRHSTADIMAAFRGITMAPLTPTAIARMVTGTGMAATTRAIRTTTIAPGIAVMIDRSLGAFRLGWPGLAITRARSTA